MGSANIPEGLVKKEMLIIAVLVALVVGFLVGVFFSSFRAPQQSTIAGQGKAPQSSAGPQTPAGPTMEQAAQIFSLGEEVKVNPKNIGAWNQLGHLYFDTNQPGPAIEAYKRSLELNQGQAEVWTDLGVMYRSARQFQEAISAFEKAIALKPGLEQAWFNKGIVLMYDLGDKEGAIKAWQQLVVINPGARTPRGDLIKDMIANL